MGRRRLRDQSGGDDEQGEDSDSSSTHGGLRVRSGFTVQGGKVLRGWQEPSDAGPSAWAGHTGGHRRCWLSVVGFGF